MKKETELRINEFQTKVVEMSRDDFPELTEHEFLTAIAGILKMNFDLKLKKRDEE